jgi:hypothetical protein
MDGGVGALLVVKALPLGKLLIQEFFVDLVIDVEPVSALPTYLCSDLAEQCEESGGS